MTSVNPTNSQDLEVSQNTGMDKPKSTSNESLRLLFVGITVAFILWFGYWFAVEQFLLPKKNPSDDMSAIRGQFGDMFGGVNALFTAISVGILAYTMLLQRTELRLQREELEATREELKRSATAQENTWKTMVDQTEAMRKFSEATIQQTMSLRTPKIIVFSRYNGVAFYVVIKNIGKDAAFEIRFSFQDSLPPSLEETKNAFRPKAREKVIYEAPKEMSSGPLFDGLPFLAPEEEREIQLFNRSNLLQTLKPISVKILSKSSEGVEVKNESIIEFKSFLKQQIRSSADLSRIASGIAKIANNLER